MATKSTTRRPSTGAAKPKVPCLHPDVCGVKNHMVGTFSQRRCQEVARRIASGESITALNVADVRPPGSNAMIAKDADTTKDNMDRLKSIADAWKDTPKDALAFVRWSSQFRNYSPFNRLMIYAQNPDATQVASGKKWEEVGRVKNEDAEEIAIFAPGSRPERPKKDENGNIIRDKDGKMVMERVFVNKFRAVAVYDISSTSGDTPPEVPTEVPSREALEAVLVRMESDYNIQPTGQIMAGDVPARINSEGVVVFNTATQDEDQRLINRLTAAGMAASIHLRSAMEKNMKTDDRKWGNDEHMYAGIAAAHSIAKDVGIDMTDVAVEVMGDYKGKAPVNGVVTHASKVMDHIADARNIGIEVADAISAY